MKIISKPTLFLLGTFFFFITHAAEANSTNIQSQLNYHLVDSAGKDTVYEFTGRLVEAAPISSSCDDIPFAIIQKFEYYKQAIRGIKTNLC